MGWQDSFQPAASTPTASGWQDSFQPAASARDTQNAAIKAKNQSAGFLNNFGKSIGIGFKKRGAGVDEAILNALQFAGVKNIGGLSMEDLKGGAADVENQLNAEGTGTGAGGVAGEIIGDPLTYLPFGAGAKSVKALMAAGAGTGALAGATQSTGNEKSTLTDNAKNAGIGTVIGAGTGAIAPAIVKAVGVPISAAKSGVTRIAAALGSDSAADRIVYSNLAQKLAADGLTPQQIEAKLAEARASGLSPTVGEATGSRSVLQAENKLASGTGPGAQAFNASVVERGAQDIPATMENMGRDLKQPDYTKALYDNAEREGNATIAGSMPPAPGAPPMIAPPGGAQANPALLQKLNDTVTTARTSINDRLAQLGNVRNPESLALNQAKIIFDQAEKRGGDFSAILDAKKQLDNLYIDGADSTVQKQANRYVTDYIKKLDGILGELAPQNYPTAKTFAKAGMAGNDMVNAVNESGVGDVNAMYNTMWKTPEQRADFLSRLPDEATRGEYKQFFNMLERVRNGFGGQAAGIAGGAGGGSAIPLSKAGLARQAVDKVGEFLTPENIGTRGAEAAFNPNAKRLARGVEKAGTSVADSPALQGVVGAVATQRSRSAAPQSQPAQQPNPAAPFNATKPPQAVQQQPAPAEPHAENDFIGQTATQFGNNPQTMRQIAMLESSGNPDAKAAGSSAGGLYQFTDDKWREMVGKYGAQYGIKPGDKMNPKANTIMANLSAKENTEGLRDTVGRDPNAVELYLAHFLGLSGAKKLLTNLDKSVSAAQLFPTAASANARVFFQNGKPLTPAGIYRTLAQRMEGAG